MPCKKSECKKSESYDGEGEGILLNKVGSLAFNAILHLIPDLVSKLGNTAIDKLSSVIKSKLDKHVKSGDGFKILGNDKGNGSDNKTTMKKSRQGMTGSTIKGNGVYKIEGRGIKGSGLPKEQNLDGSGLPKEQNLKNNFKAEYYKVLQKMESKVGSDTTWSNDLHKYIMSNSQLKKNYKGIYSFDQIKTFKSKAQKQLYILNTADGDEPGEHWVLYIVHGKNKYIYDCLGKLNKEWTQDKPQDFKLVSSKQYQGSTDMNCGAHCLTVIYLINKYGYKIIEFL